MKTNVQNRRGFTLVELLVVIVIIASLAGLTAPMVIRQRKKADQTEAISNARQIGLAFLEFDNDYGSLPGTTSLTLLDSTAKITGTAGADSNGYFKMLMQADLTQAEQMFYAKARGTIKPDGNISTNGEALKAKEVGFGYVAIGTEGLSSAGNPARPVIMSPLTPGAATLDPAPFDKNLVVLRMDNSATSLKMKVAEGATVGTVSIGGQDLFTSGNPVWDGATPAIKPPLQ
jgi:prepilin-type N-terminal cleavage/methylation domain-containing protein